MDNIIKFGDKAPVEPTFDYEFTFNVDAPSVTSNGILSFNPVFAATVDQDGKLIFAVPMDQLRSIRRIEPRPALNA